MINKIVVACCDIEIQNIVKETVSSLLGDNSVIICKSIHEIHNAIKQDKDDIAIIFDKYFLGFVISYELVRIHYLNDKALTYFVDLDDVSHYFAMRIHQLGVNGFIPNIENKEFLREQSDIIGHVAIEYFDTLLNKPYILGCVIQLVSNQLSSVDFYEIKGNIWNDNLFFTNEGKVRSFDSLFKEGQTQRLDISRVSMPRQSERARANAVRKALGVPEKYDVLFSKAMSFEPLNDINKFAIDFLLPEQEIDLKTIKGAMDDYRELQVILQNELRRKELLQPIFDYKDRYEGALRDRDVLDLLLIKSAIDIEEENIKNNL